MPDSDLANKEVSKILRDWGDIAIGEAIVVTVLALLAVVVLKWLIPKAASRVPDRLRFYILPWQAILRLLVLIFLIVYVTPMFIRPTPENLLAIGGAVAVALGFAFKDYVSSLIAGVVALYERPYRSGDWIKIEDTYGEVQSLDLRTVQVLTPDDTMVAIPHEKIWTNAIYNANSGQRDLMCVVDFYLHPDHDGQLVRQTLNDIALTSPYLQMKRPVIVVAAEKPWGTHYRLKAYPIEGRDQFQFITDLTLRGKSALRSLGLKQTTVTAVASESP